MTSPDPEGPGAVVVPSPLAPGRRSVLHAVRLLDVPTVERVADALGMTVSGARQHLAALVDDGLVSAAEIPRDAGARGRRKLRYSVTDAGDRHFPKAYDALVTELLGHLAAEGGDIVDRLFERRRDERIAAVRRRLATCPGTADRVRALARVLDEEGYLATVEITAEGPRLVERNCAIAAVARHHPQACAAELALIRAVLPGTRVERVRHLAAGDACCAYDLTLSE